MTHEELVAAINDLNERLRLLETSVNKLLSESSPRHPHAQSQLRPPATPTLEPKRTSSHEAGNVPHIGRVEQIPEAIPVEKATTTALVSIPHERSAPITTPRKAGLTFGRFKSAVSGGRTLEELIAERWMAWVGSLVLLAAVGFFIKLGFDMGWWARLGPLGRCLACAAFGFLLLIGGEWARRKINRAAAVGLFAAGIGTLYLTSFATFRTFHLLSQTGAFWLLIGVVALGIGLTLHARMVSIGVLSILGGYLTPILLTEASSFAAALPLYISTLLVIALVLSAVRPSPFSPLRYVAVVCHVMVATLWLDQEGRDSWIIALLFGTFWWLLVTAQAVYYARANLAPIGNAVISLVYTLWYAAANAGVLERAAPGDRNWLGLCTLAVAGLSCLVVLGFGVGAEALKRKPTLAIEKLSASLWAQCGILLTAAVALQFREQGQSFGQSIGWLGMAPACVELGRALPSRSVSIFGLCVGMLAIARIWGIDPQLAPLQRTLASWTDLRITGWSLLALAGVLSTHWTAQRYISRGTRWRARPLRWLAAAGTLQWLALAAMTTRHLLLESAWLLGAVLLLALAPIGQRQRYATLAFFLLLCAAAKWTLVSSLRELMSDSALWLEKRPLLNPSALVGLLITFGWFANFAMAAWLHRQFPGRRNPRDIARYPFSVQLPLLLGMILFFVVIGFEVDRAIALHYARSAVEPLWPRGLYESLWQLLVAGTGAVLIALVGLRYRLRLLTDSGWLIAIVVVVGLLIGGLWGPRLEDAPIACRVVLNWQFAAATILAAAMAMLAWCLKRAALPPDRSYSEVQQQLAVTHSVVVLLLLAMGSLEIDRFCFTHAADLTNPRMALQTGLSVYWGLFSVAIIIVGFRRSSSLVRYAGLFLMAITLVKVIIVDLAYVQYVYRVLSLLGMGLILVATSLGYAKVRQRKLANQRPPE